MRGRDVHISAASFFFFIVLLYYYYYYYYMPDMEHDCLVKNQRKIKNLTAADGCSFVNSVTLPPPLRVSIVCHCKVLRTHSCD